MTPVEIVGDALRAECRKIYGTDWSNDVAWQFARAAIKALREPTPAIRQAIFNALMGDEGHKDGWWGGRDEVEAVDALYRNAIDAALAEDEARP